MTRRNAISGFRLLTIVAALLAGTATGAMADPRIHHLAIQVDRNDAETMNLALNNAANVTQYYTGKGEEVQIEIVAFGPGLTMLREDTSPVKARLKIFADSMPNVTFDACNNTLQKMEKAEGRRITLVPEAHVVPAGVVRIMELEEHGWSYLDP